MSNGKKKMKCDRRKRFEMIYYLENITGFFFSNGKILIHATSVQEFTGVETVLDYFFHSFWIPLENIHCR